MKCYIGLVHTTGKAELKDCILFFCLRFFFIFECGDKVNGNHMNSDQSFTQLLFGATSGSHLGLMKDSQSVFLMFCSP